jgi:chromosome segregation ATPase
MVLASNIQSSTAVSQFEAWSREENSLRAAAAQADRDRLRVEERLRVQRLQVQQLSRETREASDALGRFHRERGLLQQEKERLEHQLHEERLMLEDCAAETEQLVTQETMAKKEFCKEMEALNEELSSLLMQQEDRRLQKLMCTETVTALRDYFAKLDDSSKQRNSIAETEEAMEAWMVANSSHQDVTKECEILQNSIEELRARVLQQSSSRHQPVRTIVQQPTNDTTWLRFND